MGFSDLVHFTQAATAESCYNLSFQFIFRSLPTEQNIAVLRIPQRRLKELLLAYTYSSNL